MNPQSTLPEERTLLETFLHYVAILYRYRWLIVGITAGAAIGVVVFCVVSVRLPPDKSPLPNQYTASAVILVRGGAETDLSSQLRLALGIPGGQGGAPAGFDNSAFLLVVLQSRMLLDRIAEELDVAKKYRITEHVQSQSRKVLLSNLRFLNDRPSGALTISYRDTDPVFAKTVANRMVSLLTEWYSQNMGDSNQRQRELLKQKIAEVKADIDRLEGRQHELQQKYGVLTAEELGASQKSELAALRSQLILMEIDIKNYAAVASEDDPRLAQLQTERQNILQAISAAKGDNQPESGFSSVQGEFNNLTVQLEVQRKVYNTLSHQLEVVKLTVSSGPPFQVMELAEVPDVKSGPQRMQIVAEVVALAFFFAIALALFLDGIRLAREKRKAMGPFGIRLLPLMPLAPAPVAPAAPDVAVAVAEAPSAAPLVAPAAAVAPAAPEAPPLSRRPRPSPVRRPRDPASGNWEPTLSEPRRRRGYTSALPLRPISVTYPRSAEKLGQQGLVKIQAGIDANGVVTSCVVFTSSGFAALDDAALNAVRNTAFVPARRNGGSVESRLVIPMRFQLPPTLM